MFKIFLPFGKLNKHGKYGPGGMCLGNPSFRLDF